MPCCGGAKRSTRRPSRRGVVAPASSTIATGNITAGPLLASAKLQVQAYKLDGTPISGAIADVQTATYTVPTEGPEADGTFSWPQLLLSPMAYTLPFFSTMM